MSQVAAESDFILAFAEYFDLAPGTVTADSSLVEDLGFDSIMFFETILMLEEYSSAPLDERLFESLRTVRDVYHYYSTFRSSVER